MRFPIVTISGSMRYYETMLKYAQQLTYDGFIVLMPHANKSRIANKDDKSQTDKEEMLDMQHMEKIKMCDLLFVVDRPLGCDFSGKTYMGISTKREIEYAINLKKTVAYSSIVGFSPNGIFSKDFMEKLVTGLPEQKKWNSIVRQIMREELQS